MANHTGNLGISTLPLVSFQSFNSRFSPVCLILSLPSRESVNGPYWERCKTKSLESESLLMCVDKSSKPFLSPLGTSLLTYPMIQSYYVEEANELDLNVCVSDFISKLWSPKSLLSSVLRAAVHSHDSLLRMTHLSKSLWPKEPQSFYF